MKRITFNPPITEVHIDEWREKWEKDQSLRNYLYGVVNHWGGKGFILTYLAADNQIYHGVVDRKELVLHSDTHLAKQNLYDLFKVLNSYSYQIFRFDSLEELFTWFGKQG